MPGLAGEGRVEKRFRVAREGQTVDGRELSRDEIQQMADTYNPQHYAGRINIEHFAGWSPDPPFNAYGDIIKVEAVEEGGKMCLYNTISALPNFIKMNKQGQKIYPSIEFYRNFAGTGKAYQVGLGLTDTPASLGTEAIKFNASNFALHTVPDKEIFMTTETQQDENKSLLQQIKELMTPQPPAKKPEEDDLQKTLGEAIVSSFGMIADLSKQISELKIEVQKLSTPPASTPPVTQSNAPANEILGTDQIAQLQQQFTQFQQQLENLSKTPVNQPPPGTGAAGDATPY